MPFQLPCFQKCAHPQLAASIRALHGDSNQDGQRDEDQGHQLPGWNAARMDDSQSTLTLYLPHTRGGLKSEVL